VDPKFQKILLEINIEDGNHLQQCAIIIIIRFDYGLLVQCARCLQLYYAIVFILRAGWTSVAV